ncbi:germ cell nuclear acidic protein [Hyperolius riggenbachi]|uniref:germ cell nuclear acidic protein n=1 Tax=Hyperolius riggenbachi TaxID=752182 RepID=UPI0035A2D3F3
MKPTRTVCASPKPVLSMRLDDPVFVSDSDDDSIVIRSRWCDRSKTNRDKNIQKNNAQKSKSVPQNYKESCQNPPDEKHLGRLENVESPVAVSSDDEFECLMDRIKNWTKSQTPSSSSNRAQPKAPLTEPAKIPCLDVTNKKIKAKKKPQSCSDFSNSPYFTSDQDVKELIGGIEKPHPGNMSLPCKVHDCFLNDLSCPTSLYVKNFKQKKSELSARLYSFYNRTIFDQKLPDNMEILWNKKMRKTAGYCVTGQKKLPTIVRYARIELSEKVCDSADRLRDTLIHEICHAATWLINGVRDGHGQYWRFYARKATLVHPELPMVTRCHSYEINYKFTYECSRCKNTIGRHSKSLDTERFVCALCQGKLVLQTANGKNGSPSSTQLTPFAKYVKENYGCAKKEMTGKSHAEVMRKLSAEFSSKAKISN